MTNREAVELGLTFTGWTCKVGEDKYKNIINDLKEKYKNIRVEECISGENVLYFGDSNFMKVKSFNEEQAEKFISEYEKRVWRVEREYKNKLEELEKEQKQCIEYRDYINSLKK